jgi:hypothetical protein
VLDRQRWRLMQGGTTRCCGNDTGRGWWETVVRPTATSMSPRRQTNLSWHVLQCGCRTAEDDDVDAVEENDCSYGLGPPKSLSCGVGLAEWCIGGFTFGCSCLPPRKRDGKGLHPCPSFWWVH